MLFATTNLGKVKEVEDILKTKVLSLKDLNEKIEVERKKEDNAMKVAENGKTFLENAIIKAKTIYEKTKIPTLAEDSGLEIEVLDGFPGVLTNRFLGEKKTDSEKNQALLNMMKDKENRNCQFVSAFAFYDGKHLETSESVLKGTIAYREQINMGFGFDSIFLYKDKFLSDMTIPEKNKISPRQKALKNLGNIFLQKDIDLIN